MLTQNCYVKSTSISSICTLAFQNKHPCDLLSIICLSVSQTQYLGSCKTSLGERVGQWEKLRSQFKQPCNSDSHVTVTATGRFAEPFPVCHLFCCSPEPTWLECSLLTPTSSPPVKFTIIHRHLKSAEYKIFSGQDSTLWSFCLVGTVVCNCDPWLKLRQENAPSLRPAWAVQ